MSVFAQCPTITNLNVTLGANGTATVSAAISGTVNPATYYYWQISPSGYQTNSPALSQGEFLFPTNGVYSVCLQFNGIARKKWTKIC